MSDDAVKQRPQEPTVVSTCLARARGRLSGLALSLGGGRFFPVVDDILWFLCLGVMSRPAVCDPYGVFVGAERKNHGTAVLVAFIWTLLAPYQSSLWSPPLAAPRCYIYH